MRATRSYASLRKSWSRRVRIFVAHNKSVSDSHIALPIQGDLDLIGWGVLALTGSRDRVVVMSRYAAL
jgi:hypothetical protein